MMRVTIDPIIYQVRASGGVARIYSEILPLICQLEPNLSIHLQLNKQNGSIKQALPQHKNIHLAEFSKFKVPNYRPYRFWELATRISNLLVDLQQSWSQRNNIWHSTYFTLAPKAWMGKSLVTVYDMNYELLENYADDEFSHVRHIKAQAVKQADMITCISETVKQDLVTYYKLNPDKVYTTPLAYNHHNFRVLAEEEIDNPVLALGNYILYVGGRGPHKNFDGLLKAYSLWKSRFDVKLVVVGQELNKAEQLLVSELGIENLILLSNTDDRLLSQLYNKAQAFIYPSHYEGFGIPLLEAMACGCPIVASKIPTSLEVAKEIPFYFTLNDVDEFLFALDNSIAISKSHSRIQEGVEQAKEFTWLKTAELTLQAYKILI